MNAHMRILCGAAAVVLSAASAQADCTAELAALGYSPDAGTSGQGISKDGSLAPLETGENGASSGDQPADSTMSEAQPEADGNTGSTEGIAKDGTTAPLETPDDLATSGDDAQAQQEGEPTAAETAKTDGASGETAEKSEAHMAAVEKARAALAAGDEAGCMAAVEEAKKS
ncbi:hypothetical protein [Gemmobacter sp. 24YEA27]|uniref:hypothetical protein n=1 Tax=Gemmobacter sp. 24YEA27 TaxID=3040672 RepID=UPI0024B3C5F1|nr:hypothetical protein [Gemmobacter sp. 24YEA27]